MTGYLHEKYAKSFEETSYPILLTNCQGWLLLRNILELSYKDAMGCYPLFCCNDWSKLYKDLDDLQSEIISAYFVADPFGNYCEFDLKSYFKDICFAYKAHFVINLSHNIEDFVSLHHKRNAKKALSSLRVEKCEKHDQFLDDWISLYNVLIKKHNIQGITKFSPAFFAKQFKVPGLIIFRASHQEKTVGMMLWYIQNDIAYYHLGAYNNLGYELKASFALFWIAIEYFTNLGLKWLNLGAGAGVNQNNTDGLTRFKKGWSTETKTAYFCGKIFDLEKYNAIIKTKLIEKINYFPAYRFGEFK